MNEKNIVVAKIYGNEYTIVGTESSEYITKVCNTVDEKMRAFSEHFSYNPMRTAVLCSVNMCDELLKCEEKLSIAQEELNELKNRITELEKKNMVLNGENDYLKRSLKGNKMISGENK